MAEMSIDLPMALTIHERKSFPTLHEAAAEFSDPGTGEVEFRITRSITHPFLFFLFAEKEGSLPNGTFVASIDISPAVKALVDQWPSFKEAAS